MNIKKLSALILALILALSVFAACTEAPDETDNSTDSNSVTESATETETERVLSDVSAIEVIYFLNPERTYASSFGSTEYIFNNVESKEDIISKFTEEDFSIVDTTPAPGAKFETIVLHKFDELITLYWTEAEGEMRILLESLEKDALSIFKENPTSYSGEVTVAQMGTERVDETDNPFNGMCYIVKLASGKAIIVDGGFPNEPCADNLFKTIERMDIAKDSDGKYMIEAWFFSHGHGDHYGIMEYFAPKYGDKVTVESFLYNMPASTDVAGFHGGEKTFHDLTRATFPESNFIIPHAGIKYYIGNTVIDMIFTPDLIWSPETPITHYNSTSTVFKLQGGGASIFIMGDSGEPASEAIRAHYDISTFKSDVLQITHHGLTTGGGSNGHEWDDLKKIYDATEATYAVLPMHSRYKTGNERNGRFTVLVQWCNAGYQSSYVMNESDNHGLNSFNQNYYNDFCDSVREGTNKKNTLYGYDGVNKVVNENGLITYLGGNEYKPMITIFKFSNSKATVTVNEELYSWFLVA